MSYLEPRSAQTRATTATRFALTGVGRFWVSLALGLSIACHAPSSDRKVQSASPSSAQSAPVLAQSSTAPAVPSAGNSSIQIEKDGPRRQALTEAQCQQCQGQWGRHGLLPKLSCNCRTTDQGKPCRDGRECEGECVADQLAQQIVDPGPPPVGYWLGGCSEFVHAFGCHYLLADGVSARGPSTLDDPPAKLCVD